MTCETIPSLKNSTASAPATSSAYIITTLHKQKNRAPIEYQPIAHVRASQRGSEVIYSIKFPWRCDRGARIVVIALRTRVDSY